MTKRLIALMAALLLLSFAASGCGDDEGSGEGGDTAVQTVTETVTEDEVVTDDEVATDTETVTDETDTDVTSDDNGGAAAPQNRERVEASCKKAVTSYPQISEDAKSELEDLCERTASGDADEAREAAREVCQTVVDDVYPSGVPGKEKALSACQSSVK